LLTIMISGLEVKMKVLRRGESHKKTRGGKESRREKGEEKDKRPYLYS